MKRIKRLIAAWPEPKRVQGGYIPRGSTMSLPGEGGCTYYINVTGPTDPADAAKKMQQALLRHRRTTGRPLGLS